MAIIDGIHVRIVLAVCVLGFVAGQNCRWTGSHYRFGPACDFQCHCRDQRELCDKQTGNCSISGCSENWMGPGCQYRNKAKGTDVDANYGSSLTLAVDGLHETCTTQPAPANGPFVRISLPYEILITEVTIRFKNYTLAAGFSVYAGLSTTRDQRALCGTDPDVKAPDHIVSVVCSRPMPTRFVTIFLNGQAKRLEICELGIPEGRQLSYIKPMFGSSVGFNLGAMVNGQTGDEAYTDEEDSPWVYVDLLQEYTISLIDLYNNENVRARLIGFEIYLSTTEDFLDAELVYVDYSSPDNIKDYISIPLSDKVARYVRIAVPGVNRRVQLREFVVFGGCLEKRCGLDCELLCYCDNSLMSLARRTQGICSSRCDRNWLNNNGRCDTSVCADGRFGYECAYDCNCNGTCNPWHGRCLVESDTCAKHYYGTRCQGYNLIQESVFTAQGNTTYSSAEMTVDGLVGTCGPILAGQAASWTVPLGEERRVDQILIHVNEKTTGFGLEVITETDNSFLQCDTFRKGDGDTYLARCRNVLATHIRLRTRSTVQICEVAVLDCPDGTFGEMCNHQCLCLGGQPCNKTTGACPPGGCDAGFYGVTCEKECIAGTFGRNCNSMCGKCKDSAACDIFSGNCPGACQAGWQAGRCNIECRNGTYGEDCIRDCGLCLNGQPCDKTTGECAEGCHAGYYTKNCSVECVSGRYGYNCNETCGLCKNNQVCDRRDGSCQGGCVLGMMPPLCQSDCDHGTYGEGCIQQCGDCRYNMTCNPITGVCHDGCDPGVFIARTEPMCSPQCADGYFGYNCSEACYSDICEGNNVCNKSTGGCLRGCLNPGVQPPLCLSDCYDGSFGLGCVHLCGMCRNRAPCNKTTGYCPYDCNPGFTGLKCDITEWSQRLTLSSTIALAFGIVMAVLGLTAVLVAIFFWRRARTLHAGDGYKKEELPVPAIRPPPRNASLVSRVYENNISDYDNVDNLKRSNSKNYLLSDAMPKGTVAVEDLWDYVQQTKTNKTELSQQFAELSVGLTHPCEAAKKAQNIRKNRYKEIFPYDHSRLKLDMLPGDEGNDYINACYVSGYNRPHMYIAAQGPTEELACDFWRMIWQKKCRKIVMLTGLVEHGKVKCCQYWPDEGSMQHGAVFVELKTTDLYADYNIRTFAVSTEDSEEIREVRQFHYEAWPDRHVPDCPSSVVQFWAKVRGTEVKDNVSQLVHCSAGIGRTGTFLALEYLAEQASVEGYVNIFQCVQNLRHQRVNMVQNEDQYIFLHDSLVEALLCPGTAVRCEKFAQHYRKMLEPDTKTREPKLKQEFEKLQHVTRFSDSQKPGFYDDPAYKSARSSANVGKNRDQQILPSDKYRPLLSPGAYDRNDYINAVFMPTYREDRKYLITQNPLPDTCTDFWQMVYENKANTIVMLENTSELYWPTEGDALTLMPFQIHHVTEVQHVTHIERTMTLVNAEQPREKSRLIKQFEVQSDGLTEGQTKGGSESGPEGGATAILSVHEAVLKWQQLSPQKPIVVHCLNGADKSGVYCVATSAIERLKDDREVALLQTIKQERTRRQQLIPTYEQYKFCHDVVLEFLKSFDAFSDFYI